MLGRWESPTCQLISRTSKSCGASQGIARLEVSARSMVFWEPSEMSASLVEEASGNAVPGPTRATMLVCEAE